MVDISRNTYERNGVKTIADSDAILGLNKKHIEEGLDYKNLRMNTVIYLSDYRIWTSIWIEKTTQQNFYTQRINS